MKNIPRTITITPCLNGYITKVGCQTVVHDDTRKLMEDLGKYLTHPMETEVWFARNAIHRELIGSPLTPPPPCGPCDNRDDAGIHMPGQGSNQSQTQCCEVPPPPTTRIEDMTPIRPEGPCSR